MTPLLRLPYPKQALTVTMGPMQQTASSQGTGENDSCTLISKGEMEARVESEWNREER